MTEVQMKIILFILVITLGSQIAFAEDEPKGWFSQMAAIDIMRFMPYLAYGDCKYRNKTNADDALGYFSRINSSAMLLDAFSKLSSGESLHEFEAQVEALKSANAANCRLAESWEKVNSKKLAKADLCSSWMESHQKLYEEYSIRIGALVPLEVLNKRDAALVPLPLDHSEFMNKLRSTICSESKNLKKTQKKKTQ